MRSQSQRHSFLEVITNNIVGVITYFCLFTIIDHVFETNLTAGHNFIISIVLVIVSFIRQFMLRRIFNRIHLNKYKDK